jgi:tRNA-dihydrouridine synthase B
VGLVYRTWGSVGSLSLRKTESYPERVKSFLATPAELPPPPRLPGWDRPLRLGSVELASRFTLAPLAGYTNLPFRMSVRDVGGVGLCTTDLVNARAILKKSERTMELLATCPEDRPLGIQIYGGGPDEMAEAAQWVEAYGATVIDINMGCPVRKVVKGGGGSAMMCDTTGATVQLVQRVVEAVKVPVTVKMRLGWDADALTAPYFAREFEQIGVAAVTIHGRTREQGFSGSVSLGGIRAVVEAVHRIPVIGNGDVRSIRDAERMMRETGCAGIAVGRGALANPWFFRQLNNWLATGRPGPRGTYEERIDFMLLHFQRMMDWKGERGGCLQFRKMAAWYCKALRTGKVIQQILVMLDSPRTLNDIAARLREQGPPAGWHELDAADANVHVPAGPIAHW